MPMELRDEPEIVYRTEQPYVAIPGRVTMQTFNAIADRLPELLRWLAKRGVEPAGPPFFKYNVIDMAGHLEVEAGVPLLESLDVADPVIVGVLPEGTYATLTHVGHPDELVRLTGELLHWAPKQGLSWDVAETDFGQRWGCRLERYKTDPRVEPDMNKWETELLFRLAD
jgi:effector-binding domain-containing protein